MSDFRQILIMPHWTVRILLWLKIYPLRQSLYSSIYHHGDEKLIELRLFDSKTANKDHGVFHWIAGSYLSIEQARSEAERLNMLCDQIEAMEPKPDKE